MNTAATLVAQAGSSVTSLPSDRFAVEVDDPSAVVIDVREADERVASGSIAGAMHVPRGLLEFRADPTDPGHDPRLQPQARVLLYCADGTRSALASASLRTLGYTSVADLEGGLRAWDEACLPLVGRLSSPY